MVALPNNRPHRTRTPRSPIYTRGMKFFIHSAYSPIMHLNPCLSYQNTGVRTQALSDDGQVSSVETTTNPSLSSPPLVSSAVRRSREAAPCRCSISRSCVSSLEEAGATALDYRHCYCIAKSRIKRSQCRGGTTRSGSAYFHGFWEMRLNFTFDVIAKSKSHILAHKLIRMLIHKAKFFTMLSA